MKPVQQAVKVSQFRQNLFAWLDISRQQPIIIERGHERYRLSAEPARRPLGSPAPLPKLLANPDDLPEFSPSDWTPDDLS